MVKKADIPDHVIDAALGLAAAGRWGDLSLAEIAEAAGLPISKVYPVFSSKQAILDAFSRRIDAAVLTESDPDSAEAPARDRLFDVLMRRFDALDPYKEGIGNLLFDQMRDPLAVLCSLIQLRRSMALMLEAAGLSSSGLRGVVRLKGLSLIYLTALRIWLRDDSPDKARTMAVLDRQLRRAEALVNRCSGRTAPPTVETAEDG
ncbi:MAG: TetR family transcriptional regulator [Kiloniellales bacterium]